MYSTDPAALNDPKAAQERRRRAASEVSVSALNGWVQRLRADTGHVVPLFDPADAGSDARLLILQLSPGSRAEVLRNSGFISVDNPDATSRAFWEVRRRLGLFQGVAHWSVVPWPTATGSVYTSEITGGAPRLLQVLELLPRLEVVVLAGPRVVAAWDVHVPAAIRERYRAITVPDPATIHTAASLRDQRAFNGGFTQARSLVRRSALVKGPLAIAEPDAGRQVEAFDGAAPSGEGVIGRIGRSVDRMLGGRQRRLLGRVGAITQLRARLRRD